MNSNGAIEYFDRATGAIGRERVFALSFLRWSYTTAVGRQLTRLFLSRRPVSWMAGGLCRSGLSRRLIVPFVRWAGIDTTELCQPLESFRTFTEFFVRPVAPGRRPVNPDPTVCASPVDGKATVIHGVSTQDTIPIKRCAFNLVSFLGDTNLARRYDGGTVLVLRLCLADYHRFHFPVDGVPGEYARAGGRYYAGGPYATKWDVPCFAENVRHITKIVSGRFGTVTMVEVGAFTIGSICQRYGAGRAVVRGELKGWFEPGGSSVVLLFEPGRMEVCDDIGENSERGLETFIRCGEPVGRAVVAGGSI